MQDARQWVGPSSLEDWREMRAASGTPSGLDVVLMTHPRDEHDVPRLFPWATRLSFQDRRALARCLKPTFGEILSTGRLAVGILFLPFFASDMIDPRSRRRCRQAMEREGLAAASEAGARIICLGGLTGALTGYGRRILPAAQQLGITLTTGHAVTAISVYRTYLRAVGDLRIDVSNSTMTVLGVGSIGATVAQLVAHSNSQPRRLVLVDRPNSRDHVEKLAARLQVRAESHIETELTAADGTIGPESVCYRSTFLVSAVSTPNIIDPRLIAPGTILVDDSQPYCWSRDAAWLRCATKNDIAPCEAGLVDCGSLNYRSHFPFDFADHGPSGSTTSWSCLAEGLLLAVESGLSPTIGEPTIEDVQQYAEAYDRWGLRTPRLQCGMNSLPLDAIRASMSNGAYANGARHGS